MSRLPRHLPPHQPVRLDTEIIEWFKSRGPGYQTRMNAVLRSCVEAQKKAS